MRMYSTITFIFMHLVNAPVLVVLGSSRLMVMDLVRGVGTARPQSPVEGSGHVGGHKSLSWC